MEKLLQKKSFEFNCEENSLFLMDYYNDNKVPESIALEERYPINGQQSNYYNTNDQNEWNNEAPVESQVNLNDGVPVTTKVYVTEYEPVPLSNNLPLFEKVWRYREQIKGISAG